MSALRLRQARLGLTGAPADVLLADGQVAAVGPAATADGRAVESIDLDGRTVLPGLWDAHVHAGQWAAARRRIDVSAAQSAVAAAAEIAARAPATGTVFAAGFRDGLWPDRPDQALLEERLPGRAVVVTSNDLHTAWLSPAALRLAGVGEHPTGVLHEADCFAVMMALPAATGAELDRWVTEATVAAAARGVVGILDFEFADNVTDWTRRMATAEVAVRVRASIPYARLDEAIERGLRDGQEVPGTAGGLRVGPVKLFADGSLNTRTAYCHDPYPQTRPASYGRLEIGPDELRMALHRIARHGLTPAVHAIGDHANDIVLTAFEQVGCAGRIEHAQLLESRDVRRFARPGLVAGIQPAHQPDDRDVADRHWAGRTGRAFRYADLLAAGAAVQLGSDAPVAPLDPWDGIAAAVGRTDDDRPAWHPEQAIALTDALAASALGRSTVRAGDPADLVVLDADPATADLAGLRSMPIWGTLLAGRWSYRR